MKDFAQLFFALDETNKTSEKTKILRDYFSSAPAEDCAWAVYFMTGRKMRQLVPRERMRVWTQELAEINDWMFQESYDAVGDFAETISLLLPSIETESEGSLADWVERRLIPLRGMDEVSQKESLIESWKSLSDSERLVMNKMITGGLRLGVSQQLVVKALSDASGLDEAAIAHRLMGEWQPEAKFFRALMDENLDDTQISKPYPFYLAYPLEQPLEALGDVGDWLVEWKWDGIRSQVIKREGEVFIWSRGEELLTERFPEITEAAACLPDGTVLDGEILAWRDAEVLPFHDLQKRITRKSITAKLLQEAPVVLMAYDILEVDGVDIREQPIFERRKKLEALLSPGALDELPSCRAQLNPLLRVSQCVFANSWEELSVVRGQSRKMKVEGFMLKRENSKYGVGRRKGDWWKWKIDPYTIDAVLIYAQRGSGKRASLYTDYTFGVWRGTDLVPFAKAYSGLTDAEIKEVDAFVRRNTLEKFGPVRTVKPELVFEIAFEGIQSSPRHKSGVAVRFPRIHRWRTDKPIDEADSLDTLLSLLNSGL
ncbi:MAG: ATP-dependent DNA ligase [Cyanobacteria bacterium]|nr:ATP-dependent DNA ligase [Cyanobacteriota bacterium]